MSNDMYQFTVPLLRRGMSVLSTYVELAREHAKARGIDEAEILNARLAPDMFSFAGQIQRASDKAKNGVSRLADTTAPAFADNEATLDELDIRIEKTIAYLDSVRPDQFESADTRDVELKFRSLSGVMSGHVYLTQVLLPDFYFHVATAHGILRNLGLAVSKTHYIGKPDLR